jgi:hypothetical protein
MPVPAFDGLGLLPAGIHDASFAEIERAMCWNAHRASLWDGFQRFLRDRCQTYLAAEVPFWIDGSFIRRKELPSDIDIVIDLASAPDDFLAIGLLLRMDHAQIKAEYHVDLWLRHSKIPNDLTAYFQYAGDKCAIELRIDSKHLKGILRATS